MIKSPIEFAFGCYKEFDLFNGDYKLSEENNIIFRW